MTEKSHDASMASAMPDPSGRLPRRVRLGSKGTIALAVLLSMAPPLCTDLYMSALPTIADDLGTSQALASLTMTVFFLFMAIGMLVLGPMSDKHGRRPILLLSCVLALVFSIACVFSPNIWFMIACRVMQGLAAGGMVALATAIVRDCFEGKRMSTVLSLTQAIAMFAPMVAPLLGVAVLGLGSWRYEFVTLAVLMGVALAGTLLLEETLPAGQRIAGKVSEGFRGYGIYLRDGFFTRLLAIGGLMSAPYMAYLAVASFVYIELFDVSTTMFGILFAVASIAAVLGPTACMRIQGVRLSTSMAFILVVSGACAVALLVVGHAGPLVFLGCFMPFMFVSTYSRPFIMGALLSRASRSVGAASSLANFSFTAIGCVGMVAITAGWPDYIIGLACITAAATLLAAACWLGCMSKERKGLMGR